MVLQYCVPKSFTAYLLGSRTARELKATFSLENGQEKSPPPPKKKVFAALAAVWGWSQGRSWRRFLRSSYGVIYVPSSTAISTTWTLFGCLCFFFFFFAGVKGWVMSSCRKTIIKMQQVWVSNCCPLQHNFGLSCFYWTWSVIKKYQTAKTGVCFWIQVKLDCSTINHNQM